MFKTYSSQGKQSNKAFSTLAKKKLAKQRNFVNGINDTAEFLELQMRHLHMSSNCSNNFRTHVMAISIQPLQKLRNVTYLSNNFNFICNKVC